MIMKPFLACAIVLLLLGWGVTSAGASICYFGDHYWDTLTDLGTASAGVDVWELVCPSGTSAAYASIVDYSSVDPTTDELKKDGILFSLLVTKSNTGSTVLRHAPDANMSSDANNGGGSGTYYLQVHKNKTTSAPVDYALIACCIASSGASRPISSIKLKYNR
jgi:hypothetical protein